MASQGLMDSLRAGAAQVDITPQFPVHLAGAVSRYRPAQLIEDPLHAKALVLEAGERRICFISMDLTIVTERWTRVIREAAERCGLEPDAVMVHVTQNHSAPSLGYFMLDEDLETPPEFEWLRGGDSRYFSFAFERIVEAIRRAAASLRPVLWAAGSGIEGRLAFNRRAITRDGRAYMPPRQWTEPLGPTFIRYMEGPMDPEVGVVCFQTPSLEMIAMLLHHTCHPVHVFPKPVISADWPGAWTETIRRRYGERCVPLVLNGCCGNINPFSPFDPNWVPDHRRMGRMLAETTQKLLETLTFREEAVLDWQVKHLRIPVREVEPELLEEARRILSEHPAPIWSRDNQIDPSWMRAASVMSVHLLRQREPELDYEVQVFRLGDVAIVGLPGEPFVEGQLRIKMASPASFTYIAHCTSQYVGYLPTREAFAHGGHEVETRYWSKLVPEALDMVVDAAVTLLQELFSREVIP